MVDPVAPAFGDLTPVVLAQRLATAILIGAAVGTEREWSGAASGPARRYAGLRTFLLLGLIGGISGVLIDSELVVPATVFLAGACAFTLVAYGMTLRHRRSPRAGTTEAAALVVLALGLLAGLGLLGLAAGCAAVVILALGAKRQLHWLVQRIGEREMYAALIFAVLAFVVLPLLPAGPFPAFLGIRPRALWGLVLLLSGINFVGYVARHAVGARRGYAVTGALAGLVSSTALTLQFARISRVEPGDSRALSLGVFASCLVLPLRMLVLTAVLNPRLALELVFYAVPAAVVAAVFARALGTGEVSSGAPATESHNPLRLGSALLMALMLEVTFLGIGLARSRWGSAGLAASSAVFGLVDLDALTVSMSRLPGAATGIAARGVAVGLVANTMVKVMLAAALGSRRFARQVSLGLGLTAVVVGVVLWWRW